MELCGVLLVWFCWLMYITEQATRPTTNCPEFVPENLHFICYCYAPNNMHGKGMTVTWPGRSPNALLSLTNVQRADNGSSYTCKVSNAAGRTLYTRYTLRVAYGPSNEHLTLGPSNLITNGSHSFSLTCNATNVYPTPKYQWSGITCDNGTADNVCVFIPDPTTDDLNNVTCTAVGSYGDGIYWPNPQQASETIQLNVSYPPAQKPVIQTQTRGPKLLQTGDNLTCTVTGGKPLVESVHFYCINPDLPDKEDARFANSVSSSVTANTIAGIPDTHMACYCNATWGTKAEYYTLASRVVYFFKPIPPVTSVTEAQSMTEEGISFTEEAYPVPDTFNFTYRGDHLSNNGSYVSSDSFSSLCEQASKAAFLMNCTVKPLNYSELLPGFYTVSVSNDFGHADIIFLIESEGILDDQDPTGIIVGWSGMLLFAVFVVIVVFLQRQRYKRKTNRWRRRNNGRASQRPDSAEDDSSDQYEEIDEHPVIHYPQPPPLPAPRHNMSAPQSADAGRAPLSSVSMEQAHPLLIDPLPDAVEDVNTVTEERMSTPPDDRPRPQLPDAGIPISIITQHEQSPSHSEPLQGRPSPFSSDAQGATASPDHQLAVQQPEEIEMRPLSAMPPYENAYTPLQAARSSDYFMYSRLDTP